MNKEKSIRKDNLSKRHAIRATAIIAPAMIYIPKTLMEYNICQQSICLNGQTQISFLNKITAYYGNSTTVHVKCAIKFSRCIDSWYDFVVEVYLSNSD